MMDGYQLMLSLFLCLVLEKKRRKENERTILSISSLIVLNPCSELRVDGCIILVWFLGK
jgi:hypothetical protein